MLMMFILRDIEYKRSKRIKSEEGLKYLALFFSYEFALFQLIFILCV